MQKPHWTRVKWNRQLPLLPRGEFLCLQLEKEKWNCWKYHRGLWSQRSGISVQLEAHWGYTLISRLSVKSRAWSWRIVSEVKMCILLLKDLSMVPNTYTGQLTTVCTCSSRKSKIFFWYTAIQHIHTYTEVKILKQTNKKPSLVVHNCNVSTWEA